MSGLRYRILRVDLTERKITVETPPEEWYRKYLGGKGLGYRYLLQDLKPGTDPLGPDNELIFMTGPFAGTIVPTSSRLAVVTKSPATGTILISLVGGGVAAEIKYSGYDGIIVSGKASKPVVLYVSDEHVEIKDAPELWGKGIHETEKVIHEKGELSHPQTLTIGPAGENLIPYACITVDSYHQAGRGGAGAVMGSKNLKAIAVKGNLGVPIAGAHDFLAIIDDIRRNDVLTEAHAWAANEGTSMLVDLCQEVGILPTRNYQNGQYENSSSINSDALRNKLKRPRACTTCPLACGRLTQADDGTLVEGPEYETIALGGSNLGIANMDFLIRFQKLCDDMGLDSISTGGVLGFAMEAAAKGIYNFGLNFGDEEKALEYVKTIALKVGIGDKLAHGVKQLAAEIGGQAFAMEVKGLEFPGYDPRGTFGLALAYATSERGACHERAFAAEADVFGDLNPITFKNKAAVVKQQQDFNSARDSLVICDFWRPSTVTLADLFTKVTGISMTEEELQTCGERIWTLGRLFNLREGFERSDDYLPLRLTNEQLQSGPSADVKLNPDDFQTSLSEYYTLRDWDELGRVSEALLKRLQMDKGLAPMNGGDILEN